LRQLKAACIKKGILAFRQNKKIGLTSHINKIIFTFLLENKLLKKIQLKIGEKQAKINKNKLAFKFRKLVFYI
jgi:hypothetical protein